MSEAKTTFEISNNAKKHVISFFLESGSSQLWAGQSFLVFGSHVEKILDEEQLRVFPMSHLGCREETNTQASS